MKHSIIQLSKSNQIILSFLLRGVHPDFFVKLDLEIAIDQQTRACD